MCWPDFPICQQYDWKTYALRVTENWRKSEKIFPNNFNSFFLFWKRNIFLVFSLSPEKVLSISFLWMVAVNNRLFQKTKQTNKKPSDHMKKNVNKQLIIWKKNSRKSRDLHVYREDWKRSHIYITILWQRTKKNLVFCCLI